MKRFFLYMTAALCLISCNNKDSMWLNAVTDIDSRVTTLEELCVQMNTNITSLETIVKALQERDYVTNVAEIKEGDNVIGYTITFAKNPTITIYKGNDGKDGVDGSTPVIGVAKDTDNIYYWTLNGSWLLDGQGNKIRVTGENGKDGKDGEDGKDGANGTDGQYGVSPKLKIESDYWYISYDNGTTWTQLSKAKGEQGDKGDKGDSMFKSVTYDENYVYMTLANDTLIKIPLNTSTKYNPTYMVNGKFSISPYKKVYFAKRNLQYQASTQAWRFAPNQYDAIGNTGASATFSGWIDVFAFGYSGYKNLFPYLSGDAQTKCPSDLTNTYYDWGIYCADQLGGISYWKTLSFTEWEFVLVNRINADSLRALATIDGHRGFILLPDNWECPSGLNVKYGYSFDSSHPISTMTFATNTFTTGEWSLMEKNGAIFLPLFPDGIGCRYWTATQLETDTKQACFLMINESCGFITKYLCLSKGAACGVRLAIEIQ